MPLTIKDIAQRIDGEVVGDPSLVINGFSPADSAGAGDLTFAENEDYLVRAEGSKAAAIIVPRQFKSERKTLIRVGNARLAFAKVLPLFFGEQPFPAGIHPTAIVASSAEISPSAHIGPYCVLGETVRIGERCVLRGANHIGNGCQLGEDAHLFPNVILYADSQLGKRVRIHAGTVIGADGFGYVFDGRVHLKVPQIGNVVIGDDVEIGANVTVDRGALGPTVIGKGTKIDNLVQIAHNVIVGEHCLLVSQAGVAGSTKLGDYVVLGGQVGLAGHLKIGRRVQVAAQSGVMNDIPDGEKWLGYPAQPNLQTKRQIVALRNLPGLIKRVEELEKKLGIKPGGE